MNSVMSENLSVHKTSNKEKNVCSIDYSTVSNTITKLT